MIPITLDSILEGILDDEREWSPEENTSMDNNGTVLSSALSSEALSSPFSPDKNSEIGFVSEISRPTPNNGYISVNPRLLDVNYVSGRLDPTISCLNTKFSIDGNYSAPTPLFVSTSSNIESPLSSNSTESMSPIVDLRSPLSPTTSFDITFDSKTGIMTSDQIMKMGNADSNRDQYNLNSTSAHSPGDISSDFLKCSPSRSSLSSISSSSLALSPASFTKTSLPTNSKDMTGSSLSSIPCISIKTELPDSCSMDTMVRFLITYYFLLHSIQFYAFAIYSIMKQ